MKQMNSSRVWRDKAEPKFDAGQGSANRVLTLNLVLTPEATALIQDLAKDSGQDMPTYGSELMSSAFDTELSARLQAQTLVGRQQLVVTILLSDDESVYIRRIAELVGADPIDTANKMMIAGWKRELQELHDAEEQDRQLEQRSVEQQ